MEHLRKIFLCIAGSFVLAFGMYQVHGLGTVTEGGTLGLCLLLDHWLSLSPALSMPLLNGICYLLGIRVLGKAFLGWSILCSGSFSFLYWLLEQTERLWPQLAHQPLLAALIGGIFVGVGVGLCVRAGGAPSGDDALAMSLNQLLGLPLERIYLVSDATVLLLSLSYIPVQKILYSMLTVVLSGQIIGWMQYNSKTT